MQEGSNRVNSTGKGEDMTRRGATRKATGEKGIYELTSETKQVKSSRGKKIPDVCYYVTYKVAGKKTWEIRSLKQISGNAYEQSKR